MLYFLLGLAVMTAFSEDYVLSAYHVPRFKAQVEVLKAKQRPPQDSPPGNMTRHKALLCRRCPS
jgi:hypothetical protein